MEWLAAAGIVAGLIKGFASGAMGYFDDQDELRALSEERNRKLDEKKSVLEMMDIKYEEAEKEANKNADRSDAFSTLNENTVSNETNNAVEALGLQQLADAYNFNTAKKNIEAQKGAALSATAASGTRTSSMNTAIELEAADNNAQLELARKQTDVQNDANLNSILNALMQNRFQIQANRTDAFDLRQRFAAGGTKDDKYAGGGSAYRQYMLNRDLQETAYDNLISDLENGISNINSQGGLNFLKRFFTGAGDSFKYLLNAKINDYSNQNYDKLGSYSFDKVDLNYGKTSSKDYFLG
ncbi:hypothetical protein [Treponema sp.]|uniref:hypothetical protein n=1 Tax=Treponema sp. TaxID=166 RepID=UPI00298E26AA|nr:hypothetical protein [Treponema sp.]MCQ2242092.1 hypothetical protein [Treponema sp.]